MRSSKAFTLCLLAVAALAPARAAATNPDAQAFFAQGRSLRQDGACDKAIIAFRHALETAPEGLGALRNIAECEEQLSRFASARIDWWALHRAVLQSNESKYEGWDKEAEAAYRRLEPKVGKLVVRLRGEDLARVKVTVDGQPLDPRLIGVEIERDLGPHTLEAFYGGVAPIVERRTLAVGARDEVTLVIPAPRAGKARGDSPEPPATGGGHAVRNAGIAALVVGGLGAVGTVVALVLRQSALSSIQAVCPSYATGEVCPASVRGDRDTGNTASLLVNVFSGVAVAGIGAGVALVVVGSTGASTPSAPTSKAPPPVALGVSPVAGGATAWATVRF